MFYSSNKVTPTNADQLLKKPKANPVFITIDRQCLNYIKSHSGLCLYCSRKHPLSEFDFSHCYKREMWVVYSKLNYYAGSLQLGRYVQLAGAKKVLIISIIADASSEVSYVN
ncbi:hypothetical protein AQUSIP_20970 [Aquicella siphonis]|uniref:Uncharacterized protein n=1 Tax=Aquicella siphonis TaxID=254247 RepID=A0A5E4PK55_9COXI|nr:hypothetical protein AQUSIP_20970 [Aquicella siphonis]